MFQTKIELKTVPIFDGKIGLTNGLTGLSTREILDAIDNELITVSKHAQPSLIHALPVTKVC
jgi:hypothetical protein